MSEQKPTLGSGNAVKGGAVVAIIAAVLYFVNGGAIEYDADETTTEEQTSDDSPKFFGLTDYLPTSTTGQIITHNHYTISYSEKHKQPEWVAYELTRDMVLKTTAERGDMGFLPDPNIDKDLAVISSDYTGSGYDRGHLLPAQDMASDEKAMKETFFMSNVSPQEPDFNRGVWKSLESHVRDWAAEFDHIYVVTGPVLTKRAKKRFPKSKKYIPVPHSFYKILLDFHGNDIKAIAFWMKNEESDYPLIAFATTIDEIEAETGIDFFSKLPDDIEDKLESEVDIASWAMTRDAYSVNLDSLHVIEDLKKDE